jgi:regulator of protease activity HflC (stomatin/prohibitin superfamily)
MPIDVGQAQFKNFDFSCGYEQNVENAAKAKTDLTRTETELQTKRIEKEKTIVGAEAEKEKAKLDGEGQAAKILAVATAQAEGVNLMQKALAASPLIVEYKKAEQWNGQLPTNIYAGAPIPFLDVVNGSARPAVQAAPSASVVPTAH